jgi:hypothetical protein
VSDDDVILAAYAVAGCLIGALIVCILVAIFA